MDVIRIVMPVFRLSRGIRLTDHPVENLPEKSSEDASLSGHHDEALHIFTMRYNGCASLCGIIGKLNCLLGMSASYPLLPR